jgi:hypothetical protein
VGLDSDDEVGNGDSSGSGDGASVGGGNVDEEFY